MGSFAVPFVACRYTLDISGVYVYCQASLSEVVFCGSNFWNSFFLFSAHGSVARLDIAPSYSEGFSTWKPTIGLFVPDLSQGLLSSRPVPYSWKRPIFAYVSCKVPFVYHEFRGFYMYFFVSSALWFCSEAGNYYMVFV